MPHLIEKLQHRPPHRRVMGGQIADIGVGQIGIGENVIAEHFHQIPGQPRIVAFGQLARLHPEITGDAEQQRHRDAPAVVLDEIEV